MSRYPKPKEKKRKKSFWIKLVIIAILVLIIWYTFKGSFADIVTELATTTPKLVTVICVSSVLYHLVEAWVLYPMARHYNPDFKYYQAVTVAFYCSFYRLSTLGSGGGVAAVYYFGRHGIGYAEALGFYTVQYVVHKAAIALFSGFFFVLNWTYMSAHYARYGRILLLAYALTCLICIGLVLFMVSKWFHGLIMKLLQHFNKSGRFDEAFEKVEFFISVMETSVVELAHDHKLIVLSVLKNMLKCVFWYAIPFFILLPEHLVRLVDALSVTSLSVMAAAVIPSPAGLGSSEFVLTSLYSVIVGVEKAGAVAVLYRIATFIFPFALGFFFVIGERVFRRKAAIKAGE